MTDLPNLSPNELHAKGDEVTLKPTPDVEAVEALDALAKEMAGKSSATPVAAVASSATPAAVVVSSATPAAVVSSATPEAAVASSATPAAAVSSATPAAAVESAKDDFDNIQLPPTAKSKSTQAFEQLKTAAREKVAQVSQQLTEAANREKKLTEELNTLRASSGKLPAEVEQELATLRAEHVALDVHNDPEFKKFDTTIQSNVEVIYSKLLESGLTTENIDRIKELGGPDKIDWTPILSKLPDNARRFIEATLVDNARLEVNKTKALESAKSNATKYTQERTTREQKLVSDTALQFTKTIPWMNLQEVPAGATAEQKAAIDASNKTAQEAVGRLNEFLGNRTPEQFAELAVGTVLAFRFKDQLTQAVAELNGLKKSSTEQVTALTKEVSELRAKLDGIKRAQLPRHGGGQIPPPPAPKKTDLNTSGADALESLAREVKAAGEDE
jgi:uncharacterized protein Yka (UPF0111/DUF47 family)